MNTLLKIQSILIALLAVGMSQAQQSLNKVPPNDLELGVYLDSFNDFELFLITGEEEIYQTNKNLKENVLRNIKNGIREGLYDGYNLSLINGKRASRTTLFFFKGELYKARWFFNNSEHGNIEKLGQSVNELFEKNYGEATEGIPGVFLNWSTKKKYLQTFLEENEFQVEYRNEKIHKAVEKLKQ